MAFWRKPMRNVVLSAAALFCFALPAAAQDGEPQPRKLTVQPAAEPKPALKYLLLPEIRNIQPGNAALSYLRAMSPDMYGNFMRLPPDFWEKIEQWKEGPVAIMPREAHFSLPTGSLNLIDDGARREFCDWDMLDRIRKGGMGTLVPEVQVTRTFAAWLALRVRLEMLEGKYDEATFTFQTLLALSRHVGEAPTLINSLVGMAIAGIAVEQIEEFIQQPGAPNLYWALMDLPHPLIDMRKAMESEKLSLDFHFPELEKIGKEALGPQELARVTKLCSDNWGIAGSRSGTFGRKLELVGLVLEAYPAARQALLDSGRKSQDIDALPMLQVVLIDHYQRFKQARDDLLKWNSAPWWYASKGMNKALGEIKSKSRSRELWPFGTLIAAIDHVRLASVRLERKFAVLGCIEAIRMHVAATGKLPAELADIADLPVPADPVTSKPFEYTVKGDTFTLRGPSANGLKAETNPYLKIDYQITIKR
jgi:hypothetical protein